MDSIIKDPNMDFFVSAILKLKTPEECYDFFEDLCTIPEARAISQRLVVAKLLEDKWVYSDIVDKVGASTATISRVSRSVNHGRGAYHLVFARMAEDEVAVLPAPPAKS